MDPIARPLPPGLYGFDALGIGDVIQTGSIAVTGAMIDAFADLTGDRFAAHLSDAAARAHGFAGRVAHGLLVLSLIEGLKSTAPARINGKASLGWDWRFARPVLLGDTVTCQIVVQDKRATKSPGCGILNLTVTAFNQHEKPVQSGRNLLMTYRDSLADRPQG